MSKPLNSNNFQSELTMGNANEEKISHKINAYRSSEKCDSPKKMNSIQPSFDLLQPSIISEIPNISEINSIINNEDSIKDKIIKSIRKENDKKMEPSNLNETIEIKKLETFGKEKLSSISSSRKESNMTRFWRR